MSEYYTLKKKINSPLEDYQFYYDEEEIKLFRCQTQEKFKNQAEDEPRDSIEQ